MKLYQELHESLNIITAYDHGHVMINKVRHDGNLIVTATEIHSGWAPAAHGDLGDLSAADIAALAALQPQVAIIGTGQRQRFPAPHLLQPLIAAGIGFEFMDLAAACRTYNILAGEGRTVALGLLHEAS